MGKKKAKGKKPDLVTVTATPSEYRESALCCAQLALWACDAFGMEQTAENARCMYRLAWSRADEHVQAEAFAADPNGTAKDGTKKGRF